MQAWEWDPNHSLWGKSPHVPQCKGDCGASQAQPSTGFPGHCAWATRAVWGALAGTVPAAGLPQAAWAVCGQAFGFLALQTTTFALGPWTEHPVLAAKVFEHQFQVAGGEWSRAGWGLCWCARRAAWASPCQLIWGSTWGSAPCQLRGSCALPLAPWAVLLVAVTGSPVSAGGSG